MKKPLVVAILNFCIPGLGYVVLKKRVIFGWLLIATDIVWCAWGFVEPSVQGQTWIYGSIPSSFYLGVVAMLVNGMAFAYDAYTLAKGK